jgi:hypothetical protein
MEIREEIKQVHDMLAKTNTRFLEYVQEHPRCLMASQFREIVEWKHTASKVKLQAWPVFINRQTRNLFAEAAVKVFNLIRSIPGRLFAYDPGRISAYYKIPLEHARYYLAGANEAYFAQLLGRGDFIFSPAGLKCLEYNIGSNLGGWQLPLWEGLYLQNPLIAEFLKGHHIKILNKNLLVSLFEHLLRVNLAHFPEEEELNIAAAIYDKEIVQSMVSYDAYLNQIYRQLLEQLCPGRKVRGSVVFCMYDDFQVQGESLYYRDKKIHLVLDYCGEEIPMELVILFKMGKVLLFNGPVSALLSNKFNICLLSESEESPLFTVEERESIKKYIPWTRRLVPGSTTYNGEEILLEDFVLARQEQLVLKPPDGHSGEGVALGSNTPAAEWRELMTEALNRQDCLIQDRITSYPLLSQWEETGSTEFDWVLGVYVYGSTYCGVWFRILPRSHGKGIINAHQGARVPIVFEVEE